MTRSAAIKFPQSLLTLLLVAFFVAVEPGFGQPTQNKANVNNAIYQAAKTSTGKEMWKGYGLPDGRLGCAAALSNVLKKAGVDKVKSPLVTAMRRQILNNTLGCRERTIRSGEGKEINDKMLLKDCRPGDILLAFIDPPNKINAGTSAHCGIMGVGTHVYTNNWMDGIWTEVEIHQMFDYYPHIRLLRLNPTTADGAHQ